MEKGLEQTMKNDLENVASKTFFRLAATQFPSSKKL